MLVALISFVYLRLLPDCFSLFDEGILAAIAERLYHGAVLYRDVFSHWTPGGFWLVAASFALGGVNVEMLRLPLTLMAAIAATALWRLARDHTGRFAAIIAGAALPLVCCPMWWLASPHWYSTFSTLMAAAMLSQAFASGRLVPLCGAGFMGGITYVLFQPAGAFVNAALLLAVVWDTAWIGPGLKHYRRLLAFAASMTIPIAVMYAYVLTQDALPHMISQTLVWNLRHYRTAFRATYGDVPFGIPKDAVVRTAHLLLMGLPPAAVLLGGTCSARRFIQGSARLEDRRLFALSLIGGGLLVSSAYYPDLIHLAFAAPPAFALLVAVLHRVTESHRLRALRWTALALMLIGVTALGVGNLVRQRSQCSAELTTSRGRIAVMPDVADDLRHVLAFVDQHVHEREPLFVYPYAPGYYFLTGRPNPTRYDFLFPYLPGANTAPQLAEVAATLDRTRPRFIILSMLWGHTMLLNYDTELERYIRANYHVSRSFFRSAVLERNHGADRLPD